MAQEIHLTNRNKKSLKNCILPLSHFIAKKLLSVIFPDVFISLQMEKRQRERESERKRAIETEGDVLQGGR